MGVPVDLVLPQVLAAMRQSFLAPFTRKRVMHRQAGEWEHPWATHDPATDTLCHYAMSRPVAPRLESAGAVNDCCQ